VSSKRGGWRANERLAAKARASISSSGGGGGGGRASMTGRASRRSLLQQPHTTRAVSKPERHAAAGLAKAAAARRSSIGVSQQALAAAPRTRQSSGGSGSSSDGKTDIFELTVRRRSSVTTGKGFLGEHLANHLSSLTNCAHGIGVELQGQHSPAPSPWMYSST
jgi:hypothetical protein